MTDAFTGLRETLVQVDALARRAASMKAAGYTVDAERLGEQIYKITSRALSLAGEAPRSHPTGHAVQDALIAGFLHGVGRRPWDAMHDYIAACAVDYVKGKGLPARPAMTDAAPEMQTTKVGGEPDVLAELTKRTNWELSTRPGDEPDDEPVWCVHAVHGGVNDREWHLISTGETPRAALSAALKGQEG